jgi:hypothetical protein
MQKEEDSTIRMKNELLQMMVGGNGNVYLHSCMFTYILFYVLSTLGAVPA